MTDEEIWKPVVGWEGLYEVSSLGRVKSLPRSVPSRNRWSDKWTTRNYRGQILNLYAHTKGYLQLRICRGGGSPKVKVYVHRLVAEAFIPNPLNFPQVLHWDDEPTNNFVSNLRWGSQIDNESDKKRNRAI